MQCPKCSQPMAEVQVESVTVDRCSGCKGLWFDRGEAEALSRQWMTEFVDTGNPDLGEKMDDVDNVSCPRCHKPMRTFFDVSETQIQYEECDEHGKFFDAGEFTLWAQSQYL